MAILTDILTETAATRQRAEALLRSLLDTKSAAEKNHAVIGTRPILRGPSNTSAIDNAIASTQRMIDTLDRVMDHAADELSDEDLALLEGN